MEILKKGDGGEPDKSVGEKERMSKKEENSRRKGGEK